MAEALLPMRKSVEILGSDMKPGMVRALITECLKCMKHKSDWQLRKQAADTIAALAASSQVLCTVSNAIGYQSWDHLLSENAPGPCQRASNSHTTFLTGVQKDRRCMAVGAIRWTCSIDSREEGHFCSAH